MEAISQVPRNWSYRQLQVICVGSEFELRSYGRSTSALSYGVVSPSPEKGSFLLSCLNILLSWQKVLWSGARYVAYFVECLPNRQDVLSLIPGTSNLDVLAYGRSLNA